MIKCKVFDSFASYVVRNLERRDHMDDTSIIELYWNRDEQAICETDKKYGKLCYRLADNILKRKEDTEECVNDTFKIFRYSFSQNVMSRSYERKIESTS